MAVMVRLMDKLLITASRVHFVLIFWRGTHFTLRFLPIYSVVYTCELNGCHAPLISNYSSASKCLLLHECDVIVHSVSANMQCAFPIQKFNTVNNVKGMSTPERKPQTAFQFTETNPLVLGAP